MKNLSERDKAVIWHPFTQMKTALPSIPIVKGKGAVLFDEKGNEYIDAVSSWWVNIHGHAHPYIRKKVAKQLATLEHVIFAGFTHPWAIELAERILKKVPSDHSKVFFSDNGSTANEVAIKMAIQYWWNQGVDRKKIIAFKNSYHGDTVGAMSVGGRGIFSTPFESIMFDVEHIAAPDGMNNAVILKSFQDIVATEQVAAFIYEPIIQGAGGMIIYDLDGMNELLKIAKQNKVLLIADEVMTGFGRTGKIFASEYYEIHPDIMTLSKALTGGTMPLSLTTCKEFIFNEFLSNDKMKTFFHGHSYTGNPTACAAALASLDLIEMPEFNQNIQRINQNYRQFVVELSNYNSVKNIRIIGTILAFDIETKEGDSYFNVIGETFYTHFLKHYVILRPLGNTIYILPPFIITDEQLNRVFEAIKFALEKFV